MRHAEHAAAPLPESEGRVSAAILTSLAATDKPVRTTSWATVLERVAQANGGTLAAVLCDPVNESVSAQLEHRDRVPKT